MKLPQRPMRFIVIARPLSAAVAPTSLRAMRLMHLGPRPATKAATAKKAAPAAASRAARAITPKLPLAAPIKVVNRSTADGALLLEPRDHVTLDCLKAQAPQGAKLLEERWYSLERPARPWSTQSAALKKPRLRAGHAMTWSVTVVLDDAQRRRLPDALVTVMADEDKGIGVEGTTNRYGKASLVLSDKTRRAERSKAGRRRGPARQLGSR